jgi:transposase InsO family protein
VVGLARSSYYFALDPKAEPPLRPAIEAVVREFPTYGSRRVTAQLRRAPYGLLVNRKRVQRVLREMGLTQKIRTKRRRTTKSEHPFPRYPNLVQELEVVRPDQVWSADITYVRLLKEFVYLAVIMDVFTRGIRGLAAGTKSGSRVNPDGLEASPGARPAPDPSLKVGAKRRLWPPHELSNSRI